MKYTTEHGPKGICFHVQNPPAAGTRLTSTNNEPLLFLGLGVAGMLFCIRLKDSSLQLYFPGQIKGAVPVPNSNGNFPDQQGWPIRLAACWGGPASAAKQGSPLRELLKTAADALGRSLGLQAGSPPQHATTA